MSNILPTVRYLIACEDIRTDPAKPNKVSLINLLSSIRSLEQPPFPLLFRELCVFVELTECRGPAEILLKIVNEETEAPVYDGPAQPWRANLPTDPIEVVGLPFRIRNIEFPEPGVYAMQFWYKSGC